MIRTTWANAAQWVVALGTALALLAPAALAQEGRCHMSAEEVYAKAGPRVVEIFASAIDPYRVQNRLQFGVGTGFFYGPGTIVTNYHVIADAQNLGIDDGTGFGGAFVRGIDPLLDIAVLNQDLLFQGDQSRVLDLAPPASIAMGQDVFAIGYPRGMGQTITRGIVSNLNVVLPETTNSWLSPFIQTDTTVNPGNSGGPLLDDCARVIGLVSMSARPGEAENTAYAIPIDVLRPAVEQILETGHVSRAWHGLYGQMVEPGVLAFLGVPYELWEEYTGFLVETVEPGSAADQIDLRGGDFPIEIGGHPFLIGGDIITEVNGQRILDRETALSVVRGLKVGATVSVVYKRGDQTLTATVALPERPVQEADLDRYRGRGD